MFVGGYGGAKAEIQSSEGRYGGCGSQVTASQRLSRSFRCIIPRNSNMSYDVRRSYGFSLSVNKPLYLHVDIFLLTQP